MTKTRAKTFVHLICSTANSESVFRDEIRNELHGLIVETLKALSSSAILINSVERHVHILYSHSKKYSVGIVGESIKARALEWLKSKSPDYAGFNWQSGFEALLVSKSKLGTTVEYILQQRREQRSFEQEYQYFLKRHGSVGEKRTAKAWTR